MQYKESLLFEKSYCPSRIQQMPGSQLFMKRIVKLEQSISESYKYSLHAQILDSFSLLPWAICTDYLVEKILPILDKRIEAVRLNLIFERLTFFFLSPYLH
jgi:hypothetical protein